MPNVIVIAGKGGTGKTTVASLITLWFIRHKYGPVLAIDADPNSSLSDTLGLKPLATVADIIDSVARDPDIIPKNMGKDSYVEYQVNKDIAEGQGFDLLVMGRPEGPGCYCYINNVLRNVTAKLIKDYSVVVIDNEAGMEHFSRKTTRSCQELIVVSDQTQVGLRSALRIFNLIDELGIKAGRKFLVVNRCDQKNLDEISKKEFSVDKVFKLPVDQEVLALSVAGEPLSKLKVDSNMWQVVEQLGNYIWPKN